MRRSFGRKRESHALERSSPRPARLTSHALSAKTHLILPWMASCIGMHWQNPIS